MTPKEVVKLIGQPRSTDYYDQRYNYGNVWVVFDGGIVGCLVKTEDYLIGGPAWQGGTCRHEYMIKKIK